MSYETRLIRHCFLGAGIPADLGTDDSHPFRKSLAGGSAEKTSAGLELSTSDADAASLAEVNMGDVLAYDIDELIRVEFQARIDVESGSLDNHEIILGLSGPRDDNADAIEPAVMFRSKGNKLCLELNDGNGRDIDDYDTQLDINTGQWQRFVIDFATGVKTSTYGSTGGKSELQFSACGNGADKRSLRMVSLSQSFDLGAYIGGLQLLARVSKSASTDQVTLSLREICVQHRDR